MTICFSGNSFKYEAEAIIKLFLPVRNFEFLFDEIKTDGDFCVLRQKVGKKYAHFFVCVSLEGKKKKLHGKLEKTKTDEYELSLCRLLYVCLSEVTGQIQPWGCLTGIRPVKKVNQLLAKGYDHDEIANKLESEYFTSREKIELAYKTALTQAPLMKLPSKSFSLYVSIPFCPSRCVYCSFVSHSMDSAVKLMPQYIEKLTEEIKITAEYADKLGLSLDTVYFGGGTPTSVSAEQLTEIMNAVSKNFTFSALREYTVEAGRADTITEEKLCAIMENGATRISINPQTMNNSVLKAIGRKHTAEQAVEAYSLARKIGFDNINMDLIAGLPTDTTESFRSSVNSVLALSPENVTVHTLTLKRSSSLFAEADLVSDKDIESMVAFSAQRICEKGYNPYYLYRQKNTLGNLENVGYAKKGKESLYNIFIMEEAQTILAVGAAASTKLCDLNSGKIERIYNYKFPYEYIGKFDKLMERKQGISEFYAKYPAK